MMKSDSESVEKAVKTGLVAVFPDGENCIDMASPYGSPTRYDGSKRPPWAPGGGSHGGIDISLEEGTPLLSLAAGTVVSKGAGGQMEGNYIFLKHAPEDTGLPYWVFSKYQHLESVSDLAVGEKVICGQEIGRSGKTGTIGGHYGKTGYPHLHLTTRKSENGDRESASLFDLLVIFRDGKSGYSSAGSDKQNVRIPVVKQGGSIWPEDTYVVWPVSCRPLP